MIVSSQNPIRTPSVFVFNSSPLNRRVTKVALSIIATVAILAVIKPPLSLLLASVILITSFVDFLVSREYQEIVKVTDPNPSVPSETIYVISPPQTSFPTLYTPTRLEIREPEERRLDNALFRRQHQESVRDAAHRRDANPIFGSPQVGVREQVGQKKIDEENQTRKHLQTGERVAVGSR